MPLTIRSLAAAPAAAALLALAACAPTPREDARAQARAAEAAACPADPAATDWNAAGYADALAGRPAAPGLRRLSRCLTGAGAPAVAPAALEAAEDAYLAGHDEGRFDWCAPSNAREMGRRGDPVALDCPPSLARAFEDAYAAGAAEAEENAGWPEFLLRPSLSIGVGSGGVSVLTGGVGVVF